MTAWRMFIVACALLATPFDRVEAQPTKVPRIGVLSLDSPRNSTCVDEIRRGLGELGYVEGSTYVLEPRWAEDRTDRLPSLAADLVRMKVDLIVSASGPVAGALKEATSQLALERRLPSLSGEPGAAEDGALLFYGPNVFEGCRRAVRYIDQILKGAKPADLPVEQPTKIDLVVNLKTAKALGLAIPNSLLLRADKVIE